MTKNNLLKYFEENDKRLIHKWMHYFEVYDHHLKKYKGKPVTILEIGVYHGGSLQMWKDYFGVEAKIYGIDIDPRCKEFEEENVKIYIGSQSDKTFLRNIKNELPKFDIIIDDGGHMMSQQLTSFKELFPHIKDDGIYICEDLHTSYWLLYGGGHKRRGTFIEFSKNIIDYLNAYHSEQNSLKVNDYTNSIHSIHYYDSVFVIQKRIKEKLSVRKTGNKSFENTPKRYSKYQNLIRKIKIKIIFLANKSLRYLRLSGFIWK